MENDKFKTMTDSNTLLNAFHEAQKDSIWKASVQRFEANLIANINKLQEQIRSDKYEQLPFNVFKLNERGHIRVIKSMHIADRVVQRSVCDNILTPALKKYLIYDNGASQEGKGIDFCRSRLSVHLQKYIRKFGTDGYILLCDFRKFFDNIRHDVLVKQFAEKIKDKQAMDFITKLIDTFKIDISYLPADQRENEINNVFNSLEYDQIDDNLKTGQFFMKKSVGIGSQISQIAGIFYPTKLDNYIKIVKGIKFYGRYMDDFYIIHNDKEFLKNILTDIKRVSAELGLTLSSNKTQIKKLKTGFTFLKIKYSVTDSGHIVKRICSSNVTRQRRKLKKLKAKVTAGKIPFIDVLNMHKSWMGGLKKFDSHRTLLNMQDLFNSLFKKELENYERKRKTRTGNPKFNVPAEFQLITDWRLENRKISGIPGSRSDCSL